MLIRLSLFLFIRRYLHRFMKILSTIICVILKNRNITSSYSIKSNVTTLYIFIALSFHSLIGLQPYAYSMKMLDMEWPILLRSRIPHSLERRFNTLRWQMLLRFCNIEWACSIDWKRKYTNLLNNYLFYL